MLTIFYYVTFFQRYCIVAIFISAFYMFMYVQLNELAECILYKRNMNYIIIMIN